MSQLRYLLGTFIKSQDGLSRSASLRLSFELLLKRPSLKSSNFGWRNYPVEIEAVQSGDSFSVWMTINVTYSSTCPCSAALARQLIQDRFKADFCDRNQVNLADVAAWLSRSESICATPHSQRSSALVTVELDTSSENLCPVYFIDLVEKTLQTPVQAAVKREDEQAFALLNGQNLMFCEDAARRLKQALDIPRVLDFRVEACHMESLHPHNAVAIAVKGVPGGLSADKHLASSAESLHSLSRL